MKLHETQQRQFLKSPRILLENVEDRMFSCRGVLITPDTRLFSSFIGKAAAISLKMAPNPLFSLMPPLEATVPLSSELPLVYARVALDELTTTHPLAWS